MTDDRPGTWAAIAAGLDEYHAVNLLEALRVVPDTGDWHGSLRHACGLVFERTGRTLGPNQTAEQMAPMVIKDAAVLLPAFVDGRAAR